LLVEFPDHEQATAVRLALAWTVLRQGQRDAARQQFLEFARAHPTNAHAVDALVLASELHLAGGDLPAARSLLDRIVADHGGHPRAELARFNRALLMLRAGQFPAAQRELEAWITRAPFPALTGRAHAALGVALLGQGRAADAAREFARAQREGVGDLAGLGLGSAALVERRWDEAARELTQARDAGTAPTAAAAEYGLAVVAFHRGRPAGFKDAARVTLDAAPRGPAAPHLLYALTVVAADERDWPGGLALARRLVADFPQDEAADDGLERVGGGAATAGVWPVAYEAYALLRQRYPRSPFVESSRLAYGKALIETNRPQEARPVLEPLAAAAPADPRAAAESWLLLARAREAGGDARGALDAFSRAARGGDTAAWPKEALLAHARLLSAERRWDEARAALDSVLRQADGAEAGETALAIGDTWARQGDAQAATEYYLTAVYLAPDSPAGRRALLSAARTLATAKDRDGAATLYRKLLAQTGLPADIADEARRGLSDLKP
ncbi:MAG TPA: tetratricopeptide repeat protein, partial [Methylomirabilota bacterium]|nr:tetratricopeptide repeat protein [Methylomirabilota bacterium]